MMNAKKVRTQIFNENQSKKALDTTCLIILEQILKPV